MARTKGARNAGFEDRRRELTAALRARLADGAQPWPSFRDLAAAAGVSASTLRHYFGDRTGVVRAVLEVHAPGAARHLDFLRSADQDFAASMEVASAYIALGLRQPVVSELHALGIAEGLGRPEVGMAYLVEILEPMIEALEARLEVHVERGEMRPADLRVAALGLISPLVLAHLHQAGLGGAASRPLDLEAFRAAHCQAFVRAYATASPGRDGPSGG